MECLRVVVGPSFAFLHKKCPKLMFFTCLFNSFKLIFICAKHLIILYYNEFSIVFLHDFFSLLLKSFAIVNPPYCRLTD